MKTGFVVLFCLILNLAGGISQETPFNPLGRDIPITDLQKQLRIQVEWIEVSHEKYTELMAEEDPENPRIYKPGNDAPLRKELTELIKKDEAFIIETAMVLARSGQRAKVESIHEYIYPTEYDPPELPTELSVEGGESENSDFPVTPPNPTAFETRNLGTTLEVDPVIGADEVTIDLNLAPELVYLTGHAEWGHHQIGESVVDVKMPSIYTMKITTQVTMIAGQYCLIGANSPHDAETGMPDRSRKVLVFVKSDLMVVGMPTEVVQEAKKPKSK